MIPGPQIFSGKQKPKGFCVRCGCTIYTLPARGEGKRGVFRTALFDGYAEALTPAEEWFVRDKVPWSPRVVPEDKCWEDMKPGSSVPAAKLS
jgi:hypothetical protein